MKGFLALNRGLLFDRVLLDWINDELHTERIIVQDIEEDLYDGQVRGEEPGEFPYSQVTNSYHLANFPGFAKAS